MPSKMRPRSPEDTGDAPPAKRPRRSGSLARDSHDPGSFFAANLLSASSVSVLANQYLSAQPFKHVVIDKIFQESLLMKVKDEIIEHLSFTEKETDIYKASPSVNLCKSFC
jgi:prolyl 3-hydroxylase /prolyl 3,4-dihydroxylase